MDRRTLLSLLGLAGGAAVLGAAVFWPETDEERIRAVLDEVTMAVEFSEPIANPVFFGSRLADSWQDVMMDQVRVHAEEASRSGNFERSRLALLTSQVLATRFSSLMVTLSDVSIRVARDTAEVDATVVALTDQGTGSSAGQRSARFSLERANGDWKISSVYIGGPE